MAYRSRSSWHGGASEKVHRAWYGSAVTAVYLVTFAIPILSMLFRSVDNPRMVTLVPNLAAAVQQWDGIELPSEEVFEIAFP
ncbi:MAG: hypothetical protein CM1200mP18_16010 [Gammaproteobacteria bacterium]|nr:MAG: hypothetical protein CM1200mP18_16010 [Gammaproteobacteria bacterium]